MEEIESNVPTRLRIGPNYAVLGVALQLLDEDLYQHIDLPHSEYQLVDEATNRWRVKIIDNRGQLMTTVEADLIDVRGDQSEWSGHNITFDGQPIAVTLTEKGEVAPSVKRRPSTAPHRGPSASPVQLSLFTGD